MKLVSVIHAIKERKQARSATAAKNRRCLLPGCKHHLLISTVLTLCQNIQEITLHACSLYAQNVLENLCKSGIDLLDDSASIYPAADERLEY